MLQPLERSLPVVNCYNEWDPLEEVIVGVVDGACVPPWHPSLKATMPRDQWAYFEEHGGRPFPPHLIDAARRELDGFVRLLEAEGVTVRRPEVVDWSRPYGTPDWQVPSGLYAAMPRDVLLVVGDEIIEAPLSWRSRYHETDAYHPLLVEYLKEGARWTAAPRPRLKDELYDLDWEEPQPGEELAYVIREVEPTFDAADFVRCGRDLFVQKSHVTNDLGILWLERHLEPDYRIHRVRTVDDHPMHIDASFMPLGPGKLLVNPERVRDVPPMFKSWDVLRSPASFSDEDFCLCSRWVNMNVLMLDERRMIVEAQEEPFLRAAKSWGFEPIPCPFRSFNYFGGSFHCATVDVRRRGTLQSYF